MENFSQAITTDNIQSNNFITEENYPITKLWIFKAPIIIIVINIGALFFGYYFPYLVLAMFFMLIANPLIRKNFHYSLDDKFFVVRQGVFSKKQRNLPYGVIQNVFVKQDIFDRIFGLASLRVENASQAGGGSSGRWWNKSYGLKGTAYGNGQQEGVGASGNKVNIPGLKKASAEELKNLILQKIKENPIEDSQSGL
jgi:membrane protein YdbS with pleckstrin-like domain